MINTSDALYNLKTTNLRKLLREIRFHQTKKELIYLIQNSGRYESIINYIFTSTTSNVEKELSRHMLQDIRDNINKRDYRNYLIILNRVVEALAHCLYLRTKQYR